MSNKKKILYFVTEDWYFCSHRLPLALAAKNEGYEVSVLTNVNNYGDFIRSHGLNLIPINISRRSRNPLKELGLIFRLIKIYREVKPQLVHHVAIKPVLYGGIVTFFVKTQSVINAIAGLGYVFTSHHWKARFLKPFVEFGLRLILNRQNSHVIMQNPDDMHLLIKSNVLDEQHASLILGSGVDVNEFSCPPIIDETPLVVLASRMLWDKGVGEFVEAAGIIKKKGIVARFALVGEGDDANPASISEWQLNSWVSGGAVEWWGRSNDMPLVFSKATIVCLPSYREGLPKVLIEAASCGRAIVTTDVPGCREIVQSNKNGLVVPPKNPEALANALEKLIKDPQLCIKMGSAGREIVIAKFSVENVVNKTLALYKKSLEL